MDSLYFLIKSLSSGESPNLSNINSDFTSATIIRNTETTNMDDGISMFLTVVSEVKSEIMLKRFGDSPKDCDFMRKYSESITVY